ncbi:MAG: isochorismatase family protein [Opitutales bacterium]
MPAALLVIDAQPPFLAAVHEGEAVRRRCHLAVASARLLGLPVLFTEQVPAKLGGTDPELLAAAGATAATFAKGAFSALAADGLRERLVSLGVDHLLLVGVEGPICVYQTATEALGEGLGVTLLADAIGARRPGDQDVVLAALRHGGAHVLPVESVFYAMVGGAEHPQFKAFTALVKSA